MDVRSLTTLGNVVQDQVLPPSRLDGQRVRRSAGVWMKPPANTVLPSARRQPAPWATAWRAGAGRIERPVGSAVGAANKRPGGRAASPTVAYISDVFSGDDAHVTRTPDPRKTAPMACPRCQIGSIL